jgi:hypothetical protein
VRRGRAEKRRRSAVEKNFRKMGGRAFLVIVGIVLKDIPSGGGKSSRHGKRKIGVNTEGAEENTESTEEEKPKTGGASSAPTKAGSPKSTARNGCATGG